MSNRDWVEAGVAVLVFAGSYVTSRSTAKGAVRASDVTREIGLATVDATREDRFIEQLQKRLEKVEVESAAATSQVETQRLEIFRLQDRVVVLERARTRDHDLIVRLREFLHLLLEAWPRDGDPIHPPPQVPTGLLDDDRGNLEEGATDTRRGKP